MTGVNWSSYFGKTSLTEELCDQFEKHNTALPGEAASTEVSLLRNRRTLHGYKKQHELHKVRDNSLSSVPTDCQCLTCRRVFSACIGLTNHSQIHYGFIRCPWSLLMTDE